LVLKLDKYEEKIRENLCNVFASSMLIPESFLKRELGNSRQKVLLNELVYLKMEIGASVQAILYRAKDLNIITQNYFKTYMTFFSAKRIKTDEPWKLEGKEESNRFKQLLFRAIGEEIISTSKAAALANMKLADLRDLLAIKNNFDITNERA
jgi:Zn-dependent peptidase ImmA (M78 family)